MVDLSHYCFSTETEPGYYEDGKFGVRLETIVEIVYVDTKVRRISMLLSVQLSNSIISNNIGICYTVKKNYKTARLVRTKGQYCVRYCCKKVQQCCSGNEVSYGSENYLQFSGNTQTITLYNHNHRTVGQRLKHC